MENKKPQTKKIIILTVAAVVLIVLILVIVNIKTDKDSGPSSNVISDEEENSNISNNQNQDNQTDLNNQESITTTTPEKIVTRNDVAPISPVAPQQIPQLISSQLPASAVKLNVSNAGFSPQEFTVKSGELVTLSVTSTDGIHTLVFDDSSLSGITLGINPLKTAAIEFTAPTKTGVYSFKCNIPSHDTRGEVGRMIVK